MDGFELNKIIVAVLIALLTAKVAYIVGDHIVDQPTKLQQQAFVIEGVDAETTADAGASPQGPGDIKPLLASADLAHGEKVFKKCAVFHTIEKSDANKVGPNLWGVVKGPKAHLAGFAYSEAMKSKGGNWGYDELNTYLYKPTKDIPGTKMSFAGLSSDKDRADVIAYMRSKADSPAALP